MPLPKILLILLASPILLSASCQDDEVIGTQLDFTPQRLEVPAGLNPILSHSFVLADLSTEHPKFEAQTNKPFSTYTAVVPFRASLSIDEAGLNWGFLQEVSIQAYTTDFSARREIFYRDQIRQDVGVRLDLIPSELDVRDLFGDQRVNLIIEFRRLLGSPPQSIPATLTWSLDAR